MAGGRSRRSFRPGARGLELLTLPAGLPPDTVLGRPGANVTLSCGAPNDTVSWELETRRGRRRAQGEPLELRALRRDDAGRYRCSADGRPPRTLRLLVQEPPEAPRVSCRRRSHDRDVLCEWRPRQPPAPGTRATLWVKRRFAVANGTEQRCRYFVRGSKFVCRLRVPAGTDEHEPLAVSTCVRDGAGGAAAATTVITLSGVLQPEPPRNVTVLPLERRPRRLRVTWAYPASWDPRFYWLRFQVRYRPEPAPAFTQVDQVTETWLEIADAWGGTRHLVQVRAREEFGHGAWSEWSREVAGTPWIDPAELAAEAAPSLLPEEDGADGVTLPPELLEAAAPPAGGDPPGTPAAPLVAPAAGASLALGTGLLVAIAVRPPGPFHVANPDYFIPSGP
ncbi:interleukin-6 receptor subunit alpha [Nothoprocta perdicaria]|uniref:interleukin-6 receptor subunit alpha n=1 Tax=Nothoprocta perdicaria TaxID=30464 RepID=UPI000E1B98DD|nr:interleukin-6 receptor subunit alpha [Nothoprocta perdicaria]